MNFYFTLFFYSLLALVHCKCSPGSIEGNDGSGLCYSFFMSAQAYYVADERCLAAGGQLASIKNAFTGYLLTNTLQNMVCDLSTLMWLGGNRIASAWHWSDGTPFTYTNWAPGQPGNGSCLVFQPLNGQWSALGCESNKQPYICEFAAKPDPPPQKIFACDSGWTYFSETNFCYKLFHNQNWTVAEANCGLFGAHLASIHSATEHNLILNFSTTGLFLNVTQFEPIDDLWIGLRDVNGKGNYQWSDGTPLDYTDFHVANVTAHPITMHYNFSGQRKCG